MTRFRWLTSAIFVALVGVYTIHGLSSDLWDDALFFQRFGRNIVAHGTAAWNVADGPVHGNTSQLFQLVAATATAIAPGGYHVAIKVFLAICLVATYGLLAGALRTWQPPDARGDLGARVTLLCGLASPTALLLVSSGMETPFAWAVLALSLLVLARLDTDDARSSRWLAVAVVLQVLVYLARPDMVLLSAAAGAIVSIRPGLPLHRQHRLLGWCALVAVALGLTLLALRIGYGTAFPLSFYLKSRLLTPYDAGYQQLGVAGERRQLLTWIATTGPFVYLALFGRRRWTAALVAPALLCVLYHYASTIGVMGYHSRFFQPATVPVALAAALAWPRFATGRVWLRILPMAVGWPIGVFLAHRTEQIEQLGIDFYLGAVPPGLWVVSVGATVWLVVSAGVRRRWPLAVGLVPVVLLLGTLFALPPRLPPALGDAPSVERIRKRMKAMKGIDIVRDCLPEPLHLYHSELGVPGVLFPRSRVTDLSGLMNPALVFGHPVFDDLCLPDPPDVLFLPHRTHERLVREILASRCLEGFVRTTGFGDTSSPLYIRRDRFEAFEACRAARPR